MDADRLITTNEVAALLGVPEPTLRYWRHVGRGPASFRVEGLVRYRHSTVLAYLREQEEVTQRGLLPSA